MDTMEGLIKDNWQVTIYYVGPMNAEVEVERFRLYPFAWLYAMLMSFFVTKDQIVIEKI